MRNLIIVAGLVLGAVLVSGCSAQDPAASPDPPPASTPVFASDEEALAAAEAAYAEYVKVSDAISAEGGANPERMAPLVTPERLKDELNLFSELQNKGLKFSGETTFNSMALQQHDEKTVDTYVCIDVSMVLVLDQSGQDVTPIDRVNQLPLAVSFAVHSGTLLQLSASESWDGDDFCVG